MIRVGKPGSKLLLLEHGTSNWGLVQLWQKRHMLKHVQDWGCYFNRDILGYLQDRSDIEIQKCERRHFGTTYYIEAVKTDGKTRNINRMRIHQLRAQRRNRGMDVNVMVHVS